ncbi:MAG: hypothetical protein GX895_13510 [Clostridiales bacterium]|uniref:hypothetical protein n=1 Tax=Clostridium sp. N3C TaxID=1776758 RepID=UPI00092DEEEC|nr:hypothetical protein [Clostridium sp. N3C]NLZ49768.1 hypothetical protein [Clostridiales bacterium]SCN24028.1 hypothetical protein N3C_1614 [Clostridium sp. N3C]
MNIIKIEGLTGCYPEGIEGTTEWYFCKEGKDNFCDLYEAEEIYKVSKIFGGMNCHLIHFPEGTLHSPFKLRENLYVESPIWDNGKIYFLSVDFSMNLIQIHCYFPEERRLESIKELPLDVVEDCYNLRLETTPLMLCRSGNNGFFEIIWPERKKIEIGDRETIIFRHGEDLYFSEWYEDPDYHENVIIRDLNTGKVKDKFEGNLLRLPNEVFWRI